MASQIKAHQFPRFEQCLPGELEFKCISPARSKNYQRCGNPVNADDRREASHLRRDIMSATPARPEDVDETKLRQFGKLCCCKGIHRKDLRDEALLDKLVEYWQAHIYGLLAEDARRERRSSKQSIRENEGGERKVPDAASTSIAVPNMGQKRKPSKPVPARNGRPLTRSNTSMSTEEHNEARPSVPAPPRFVPYKTKAKQSVYNTLITPLTAQQSKDGAVYSFRCESDPAHHKLGYSGEVKAQARLAAFQRCAGPHNRVVCEYVSRTANAKRVESLVQVEKVGQRRRELRCHNTNCHKRHREWFEADLDSLVESINYWSLWMTEARPYDEYGELRRCWEVYCEELEVEGVSITGQRLYDAWLDASADADEGYESDDVEEEEELDEANDSGYDDEDDEAGDNDSYFTVSSDRETVTRSKSGQRSPPPGTFWELFAANGPPQKLLSRLIGRAASRRATISLRADGVRLAFGSLRII